MERDPIDIAWAAGLFEGEGCFVAARQRKRDRRKVQARLGMRDRDVVERFARIVAVGHINLRPYSSRRPGHSDIWEWSTQSASGVIAIAELLLPYLGERRSARAREVVECAREFQPHSSEHTHCPHGHEYTAENTLIERRRNGKTVRRCRICRRADARRWEARRRSA